MTRLACVAALLLLAGCDPAEQPVPDATVAEDAVTPTPCPRDLDLLLVIESGGGVSEEQAGLARELPFLVTSLATGDEDGDGATDFEPIRSLHLGVVGSDLGAEPEDLAGCSGLGDDGILQRVGSEDGARCRGVAPGIFEFVSAVDDVDAFASVVVCAPILGIAGCTFEQHLEASLKALAPAPTSDATSPVAWTRAGYRPPIFRDGTFGHGGPGAENDGFLRPDSALAIIVLAEEDDCSLLDQRLLDRDDPRYEDVDLSLRCTRILDGLQPISRYVDGLSGLRTDPGRVFFGAIAGIPQESIGLDYDAILALPAMQLVVDPVTGGVRTACTSSGAFATPARRIVEVARGLDAAGAQTRVESVCNTSYAQAIDSFIPEIVATLERDCGP